MQQVTLIAFYICLLACAQPQQSLAIVTDKQWQELLTSVGNEDWNAAVKLSSRYLTELKEDDDRLKRLRYIYLYAAAGKVSKGQMSFDELEKLSKEFIGKKVVLPYRQIAAASTKGALNFIWAPDGTRRRVYIPATNKDGTTVHSFEHVLLAESFDFESHIGKEASISGIIDAIKPNPNKSQAIIMSIIISKGLIKLRE